MQFEIELPDDVLERLKQKAAAAGLPLNDYFVRWLEQVAAIPTHEEMIKRLADLTRADIARTPGHEDPDPQAGKAVSSK